MNLMTNAALKESLRNGDPKIEFISQCCCKFSWSFDPRALELICDIEDHLCYQIHTLSSRQQRIMRNVLDAQGGSRDEYFITPIGRQDIPDDLYKRVHMDTLEQVRKKYAINHDANLRESLREWLHTCGLYVDIQNEQPILCKFHQLARSSDENISSWMDAVLPLIMNGQGLAEHVIYYDFTVFDSKYCILMEEYRFFKLVDSCASIISEPFSTKTDGLNAIAFLKRTGLECDGWYFEIYRDLAGGYVIHGWDADYRQDWSFPSMADVYNKLEDLQYGGQHGK